MTKKAPEPYHNPWSPVLKSYIDSKKVNSVSIGAEMLYLRLVVQCDDADHYFGCSKRILAKLFMERFVAGHVSENDISGWLVELETVGLIVRYQFEGNTYLEAINRFKCKTKKDRELKILFPIRPPNVGHQADIRPPNVGHQADKCQPQNEKENDTEKEKKNDKKINTLGRKISPLESLAADAADVCDVGAPIATGVGLYSDSPTEQSPFAQDASDDENAIAVHLTPKNAAPSIVGPANGPVEPDYTPGFKKWWSVYPRGPRKVKRSEAFGLWKKYKLEPIADRVMKILNIFMASEKWKEKNGEYVPGPVPWLNKKPWESSEADLQEPEPESDDGFRPVDGMIAFADCFEKPEGGPAK